MMKVKRNYMLLSKLNILQARWRYFLVIACLLGWVISSIVDAPIACAQQVAPTSSTTCDNKDTSACSYCTNETSAFQSSGSVIGSYMISQIFLIINQILQKVQSTFYQGIIGSVTFQQTLGVMFLVYITVYGLMIMLNLASYRSGEMAGRLIKLAIVYAMTTPGGWTFFSTWIEKPVVGEMNELIQTMANAGSGSGGRCASQGNFSGAGGPITTSGSASGALINVQLATGPMAMLYGPMTCVFAAQFIATTMALVSSASYGWLIAIAVLWGMLEFSKMVLGAIVTYVKAIVGLTVLFGIAPIFISFWLFEKTRDLTKAWLSMVFGFALQPVMLFAFLAFYATIVGGALTNMLSDASGNPNDICYVPWYEMPRMFDVYMWRFKNSAGAAGGQTFITSGAGSGSGAAGDSQLPTQVLNVLYFVVLCNLGKNFCNYINDLATSISGGSGAGVTTGDQVGSWFKTTTSGGLNSIKSAGSRLTGGGKPTPPTGNTISTTRTGGKT